MGIANWEWWLLPVYSVLIVIFIPIYLRNKISTVPELLSRRFSSACGDIYSYIMLFAYIFVFLVPVLYGGSLTFASLTGWNFYYILWGMIALVAAYTVKGGLMSVVWTDVSSVSCSSEAGCCSFRVSIRFPVAGTHGRSQSSGFTSIASDHEVAPFLGVLAAPSALSCSIRPRTVMVQRVLGASRWDGTMGSSLPGSSISCALWSCFWDSSCTIGSMNAPGRTARQRRPGLCLLLRPRPNGGGGRRQFIAAVMSTVSALANSTATIFSLDVYKKLLRPAPAARRRLGRCAASLASLLIAGIMAQSSTSASSCTSSRASPSLPAYHHGHPRRHLLAPRQCQRRWPA